MSKNYVNNLDKMDNKCFTLGELFYEIENVQMSENDKISYMKLFVITNI